MTPTYKMLIFSKIVELLFFAIKSIVWFILLCLFLMSTFVNFRKFQSFKSLNALNFNIFRPFNATKLTSSKLILKLHCVAWHICKTKFELDFLRCPWKFTIDGRFTHLKRRISEVLKRDKSSIVVRSIF